MLETMAASSAMSLTSVSAGILKQPDQYAGQNLQVHNHYLPQTEAFATLSDVTGRSCHCCAAAAGNIKLWHRWRFATDATVC